MNRIKIPDNLTGRKRIKLIKKDLDQIKRLRPSTWGRIPIEKFNKSQLRKIIYLMARRMEGLSNDQS